MQERIMESKITFLCLVLFFVFSLESYFITSLDSSLIVKDLPGFHGDLPFTLETGYIGVGEGEAVQAFYAFAESERNPEEDPLLYHLTGGPGASALDGFLFQTGPIGFNLDLPYTENITLEMRPTSWTKRASMIFVDLPAGAGFAYGETWNATRSSDSLVSIHAAEFIRKWLTAHPRFQNNALYITGISYMGIVVPKVALQLYDENERGILPPLNINGYLIMSPLTDKFRDFNSRIEYAHRFALISDGILESVKESCQGNYIYFDEANTACSNNLERVNQCLSMIYFNQILSPVCDEVNRDPTCDDYKNMYAYVWANDKAVRKALGVREGTVETWEYRNESLHYDMKKVDTIKYSYDIFSSLGYHQKLVNKSCRALIINGDHDLTFPFIGTEKWIRNLNVTLKSPWSPWFVNDQIAGYQLTYAQHEYSMKYATVKGGAHQMALNKPEETFALVARWLDFDSYSSDS